MIDYGFDLPKELVALLLKWLMDKKAIATLQLSITAALTDWQKT